MRKLLITAMCAASLSLAYCRPIRTEPLRSSNLQMYTINQLGLIKGKTHFDSAKRRMEQKKMTGIAEDSYTIGKTMYQAMTADYQTEIHIFENSRYTGSVPVKCGPILPYGYSLRIGESEGKLRMLALYRDPLQYTFQKGLAHPSRVDVFTYDESLRFMKTISLSTLSKTHSGLTRPIFVGHDLGIGIIFLARDNDGRVWDKAYLVSVTDSAVKMKSVPVSEAEGCSCIRDYIYGNQK
jgi:hypothetical protein